MKRPGTIWCDCADSWVSPSSCGGCDSDERQETPTCFTGWKQVTDDCPVCGPDGPCVEEPKLKPSRPWRWLGKLERFLGSSTLLIVCYAVVSHKFIQAAGFHFGEWLLCLLIFINLSTKLEQIHAIAAAARQSGDVQQAPGEAPQSGGKAASPKGNRR